MPSRTLLISHFTQSYPVIIASRIAASVITSRFSPFPPAINRAFTLPELLVVVAIIGIFASLSLGYLNSEIQNSRLVALSQSMAGWLEAIRSKALAESTVCTIQFSANGNYTKGQYLATVLPSACAVNADEESVNFAVPGELGGSIYTFSRIANSFVFTKRGLSPEVPGEQIISLNVEGRDPKKCIKINKYSGLVQIGGLPLSQVSCDSPDAFSSSRAF